MEETIRGPSDEFSPKLPWENGEARRVLDSMGDFFIALDSDFQIVFVNRSLAEASPGGANRFIGHTVWELWPEMQGSVVETTFRSVFRTGLPGRFEYSSLSGVWIDVDVFQSDGFLLVYFRDITERKRLERDRAEREETFRSIVSAMPQIAWVARVDGTPTFFNNRWFEYTGLDPSDLYNIAGVVHPEDLALTLQRRQEAYSQGKTYEAELRIRRRDGQYRWHLARAEPFRAADGHVLCYFGTSTDIHEQRRAAFASHAIVEGMAVPVIVLTVEGEVIASNDAWRALYLGTGIRGQKVTAFADVFEIRRVTGELMNPADWPSSRAIRGERVEELLRLRHRETGRETVVSHHAVRIDVDGAQLVIVTAHDLTELVDTQNALQRDRERLESAIKATDLGVWRCELPLDEHSFYWSPQVKRHFGLPPDSVVGLQEFLDLLHPDDRERTRLAILRAIEEHVPYDVVYRTCGPDGKVRWIRATGNAFYREDGAPYRFDGFTVDLTERVEVEQALRDAKARTEGILASADVGTWILDVPNDRVYADRNLARMFAVTDEQANGGPIAQYLAGMHRDDRQRVADVLANSMTKSAPYDVDYRIVATGDERWVKVRGVPERDAHGRITRLVGVVVDVTDLKKTQERERAATEAVRRHTDRYRALAETAATVVFTADVDGRVTEIPFMRGADPAILQEGIGAGWVRFIHPDDRAPAMAAWRRSLESGRPYETEFRLRMATGEYRWHLTRGVRVFDEDGQTREWVGSSIDIHERVTRERTLRFIDEFTAATRELTHRDEIISLAQKMLGERLGASRAVYAEAVDGGRSFSGVENYCVGCEDLNGKLPVSGFSSEVSVQLRAGHPLVVDDVASVADSAEGYEALLKAGIAAIICMPLLKDGKLLSMFGIHQDTPRHWSSDEVELVRSVSERCWSETKRAEAERERLLSEQRLRRILAAATVGIIVNDQRGVFSYANPPLLRMLDYTLQEVERGEISWSRIQAPERVPQDDIALAQLRESGSCEPYETEFVRRDGSRIPVYVGAALIPDEGGSGQLGAAFVTDLTELKRVEAELRALNEELEGRVQERTADLEGFNYAVAHDLRSPLRAINATANMLMEELGEQATSEQMRLLERQRHNSRRLAQLIDDLLTYSRLGQKLVHRESVDVTELALVVADDISVERDSTWNIQAGMRAEADPGLLRLALHNLMDNAAKFSGGVGAVTVGMMRQDDEEEDVFFVRDQGVGFQQEYAGRLFQPFQRLVREDEFSGTGIGLANVKRIIDRHGGRIWAESAPGHGATFYFTLAGVRKLRSE